MAKRLTDLELKEKYSKEYIQELYSKYPNDTIINQFKIKASILNRLIKIYSLNRDKQDKINIRNNSIIEKYGSLENYYNLRQEKINNTKKLRYGTYTYNNRDKYINTCLEKYGVTSTNKLKEVQTKREQTTLLHYGVKYPVQNPEIKQKIENTTMKHYGCKCNFASSDPNINGKKTLFNKYKVINPSQDPTIKSKITNTVQERYGVKWACMRKEVMNFSSNSKPNLNFSKLLDSYNIRYEREFVLDNYSYDFKIDDILIEINPSSTHNSTWGIIDTKGKEFDYHYNKTKTAINNNYRCINVWDWDDINKIIFSLAPKQKIYARTCIIKELNNETTNEFLNKYHFQNTCKNQTVKLGLYHNNELVQIMTFGKPRYNKNYDYELLRLCTKFDYIVIGGAEKLFKYFTTKFNPKSIISYCDKSKFKGEVYDNLGFKILKDNSPSKHWYNMKTKKHITDNLLRQLGADKLLNTNYGKGTDNEEIMKNYGFVEIYDCGQTTYYFTKEDY